MRAEAITFVVLTYNEGKRLDRALASLPPGAEIFVLDACSTDDTLEVASRYAARIEIRPWTTFVDARRHAVTRVRTPWVFMLDADEALTPALQSALIDAGGDMDGYHCLRQNRFCGHIIRGGAWANEYVLRCVRTQLARIEAQAAGGLHERLSVAGPTAALAGAIDHDSYPSVQSYWTKFHKYTAIEACGRQARFLDVVRAVPLACARGFYHATVRGGYRDGWRGLFIACASAAYPVVVQYCAWRRNGATGVCGESGD